MQIKILRGDAESEGSEMKLFIYLISQDQNCKYDTHDSAVVCAPDETTARNMHPYDGEPMDWKETSCRTWCSSVEHVQVKLIGVAGDGVKQGLILASFNAG